MVKLLKCCLLIPNAFTITETENVYEDYYKGKESFEISNYANDSICYDIKNNLVVGNMKDKTCGVPIKSVCMYIYIIYI